MNPLNIFASLHPAILFFVAAVTEFVIAIKCGLTWQVALAVTAATLSVLYAFFWRTLLSRHSAASHVYPQFGRVLSILGVLAPVLLLIYTVWHLLSRDAPGAHPVIRAAERRSQQIETTRTSLQRGLVELSTTADAVTLPDPVLTTDTLQDLKRRATELIAIANDLRHKYDELVMLNETFHSQIARANTEFDEAAKTWRGYADAERRQTGYEEIIAFYLDLAKLWEEYAIALRYNQDHPLKLDELEASLDFVASAKVALTRLIAHIDDLPPMDALEQQRQLEAALKEFVTKLDELRSVVRTLTSQVQHDAKRLTPPNVSEVALHMSDYSSSPPAVLTAGPALTRPANTVVATESEVFSSSTIDPKPPKATPTDTGKTASPSAAEELLTSQPTPPPVAPSLPKPTTDSTPLTKNEEVATQRQSKPKAQQRRASQIESPQADSHPFRSGTTWSGTYAQEFHPGAAENSGATIHAILRVTRHTSTGFQGVVTYPSAIDGYGRHVAYGAESACVGTVDGQNIRIDTTATFVPANMALDSHGSLTGRITDGQLTGTYRGATGSRSHVTLSPQQ